MYMNAASAECKHLIYPLRSLFITIPFNLCSPFYTECQCIWFESIPNQVWSYIHQMIKTIVDFAFWWSLCTTHCLPKSASRISNFGSAFTSTCHLTLCIDVHIWHSNCLWCVDDKEGFKFPPWSQITRSNLLKICNTTLLLFLIEGVHIWHTDCLWCVDYNIGFWSLLWHLSQSSMSNILAISLWLVTGTLLSFFDWGCLFLAQLLLMVCKLQRKLQSQGLIRICLTRVCFWQRCFIFCIV